MGKTLRQRLYDKAGGKESGWNTEISPKGLASVICAGMIGFITSGCTGSGLNLSKRPHLLDGETYDLAKDFNLGEISEKNSKYQAKGLEIFKKNFYALYTDLGPAMFGHDKSLIENSYTINQEGKIKGKSSLLSGENGMYFLENAMIKVKKNKKDVLRKADIAEIDPDTNKAKVRSPKIIKKQGDLGVFYAIEKDLDWDMDYATIPTKGLCYIMRVETLKKDYDESKFYNFYVIPVDGSKVRINQQGKLWIENIDNIFRPTFNSWEEINKKIAALPNDKKIKNREVFEKYGMRVSGTTHIK